MEFRLVKKPFTVHDSSLVRNFMCGTQQWELYLSDWIHGGPDGVWAAISKGTEVWTYRSYSTAIVGFGSLGVTTWKYPDPFGSEEATLAVISAFAVDTMYKGHPEGPWEQHFSVRIMSDLVNTARQWHASGRFPDPLLGLFVDIRNTKASNFYTKFGFVNFGRPMKDKESKTTRQRMIIHLSEPDQPTAENDTPASAQGEQPPSLTFEQAVAQVVNAPQTSEQRAKKVARETRRTQHKADKSQSPPAS